MVVVTRDAGSFAVFGDRRLCGGQVDDRFVGGVGRDERGDGEVVHRARIAARGEVDCLDRVVGEEWVGPARELEVLLDVVGRVAGAHAGDCVAGGDALIQRGEHREFQLAPQGGLADEEHREV